ncbi:MAG: DUF3568 domain-containing protein [Deltaproteobacteria bacterium]|nr:DUF3568 domain-containing protein [Deltaproteobacteria bacterium]
MTRTICNNLLSLAAVWLVLATGWGCAACLSPVCLGPSATVGSSAGEAGISRYDNGKVKSYELAHYQDVVEATRRAGEALSLKLQKETSNAEQSTFYYIDDKNEKVKVTIEPLTDTLTHIEIDVGFFGSKGLALVVINQITHEIASAGKYLQEWKHLRLR